MRLTRFKVLIIAALLIVAALIYVLVNQNGHNNNAQNNSNLTPPQSAINVISEYIQARENAVGADQSSYNVWISTVKSIVTAAWYASIQPATNSSTGSVPRDYYIAHANGWIVKASVSNCVWTGSNSSSTRSVDCSISDQTIDKSSGTAVPISQIPFGWGHNGLQPAQAFKIVSQSGHWLIDSVTASQSE